MPAGLEVTTPSPPLLAWMVRVLSTAATAALGSVGLGVSWHPWRRASAPAKARRTAKPAVRRGERIRCLDREGQRRGGDLRFTATGHAVGRYRKCQWRP